MFAPMHPPHFQTHASPPFATPSPLAPRDANARPYHTQQSPFAQQKKTTTTMTASTQASDSQTPPVFSFAPPPRISSSFTASAPRPRPTHVRGSKFAAIPESVNLTSSSISGTATSTTASKSSKPLSAAERRRSAYLSRVQETRDAARHAQRGATSERLQWFEERKAWAAEREREADALMIEEDVGEANDDPMMDEVDDVELLAREEEMYAAMAEEEGDMDMVEEVELPAQRWGVNGGFTKAQWPGSEMETEYGSEDDDYDRLMMDIAMEAERESGSQRVNGGEWACSAQMGSQGMDMS